MSALDARDFLSDPALQQFVARAHRRRVPAKHTIIHAGDDPTSLYLIIEGSVSILAEDDEGREMVLAYLNAGEFFGEMCLFPHLESRSALVRSRTETWVAELNYQGFRTLAAEHPEMLFSLAGQLAVRLRDTSLRLADLAFLDVAGRIARTLLNLVEEPDSEDHERGKVVKISRQEIARIVGCSREMAGRVLKSLEQDGLIESEGRKILVIKPPKTGD